jgi:hypothetical protein
MAWSGAVVTYVNALSLHSRGKGQGSASPQHCFINLLYNAATCRVYDKVVMRSRLSSRRTQRYDVLNAMPHWSHSFTSANQYCLLI